MMRKNTSRGGGKQTSTPLSGSKVDAPFKSFGNVSTIRNEHKGARHSITGSPIIFDWKGVPESPAILSRYKKITMPAKKLNKRRCDTPLKVQRKSLIPHASAICPLKLKFSRSRLSNVNPKLHDNKRYRSARINKCLLDIDEKNESKIENNEFINKKIADNEFCRNEKNIGGPSIEGCSKRIACKINVSFGRLSKRESLLQKEYADKSETFGHTYDESYETFEYTIDATESELLHTSDMIESCRRESTIASDTVDYLSGLDMLSDAYITSSLSEQSSESPKCSDDDVIAISKLEGKSNETTSKNKGNFGDFLPEASISIGCDFGENDKDETVFKRCKTSGEVSFNEIRIGELDHLKIKDGIAEGKLSTASAGKENVAGCKSNLGEFEHIKVDEKSCKKRKKYRKPPAKGKRKQVTQGHGLEKNVNKPSILLHTLNKSIAKTTSNESFDHIDQTNLRRKDIGRNGETSKSHEDNQIKDVTASNHLEKSKECSDEELFNLSNSSDKHAIKIADDQYDAGINGDNAEKDENESFLKDLSKSFVQDPLLNSDNIQCHSGQKKNSEVEMFKKPFPVKKNVTSKQSMRDKERKAKMASLNPSTSTPVYNSSAAEGKLNLVFNSVSPIRISGGENKSYSLDELLNISIKAKQSCAKPAKVYSESNKELSKWKSFHKKPSDQKKTCYYANDSSISKSSGNVYQFENSRNEGVPIDDILILWNKFRRSKTFKKRDETQEKENTGTKKKRNFRVVRDKKVKKN